MGVYFLLCNLGQSVLGLRTDNTCHHLRQAWAVAAETGGCTFCPLLVDTVFNFLRLAARSSIAFCWRCRVLIISFMADSREEGLVEVLVSCDEATLGRGPQDFSSSSAQRIASSLVSGKETSGCGLINFLISFRRRGLLTFSAKWPRRAASWPLDLVTLFFSILACSSLSAWENAQRFRLPSVGGHKRLLRAGEQNASQQKTLEGGRRSYPNS